MVCKVKMKFKIPNDKIKFKLFRIVTEKKQTLNSIKFPLVNTWLKINGSPCIPYLFLTLIGYCY